MGRTPVQLSAVTISELPHNISHNKSITHITIGDQLWEETDNTRDFDSTRATNDCFILHDIPLPQPLTQRQPLSPLHCLRLPANQRTPNNWRNPPHPTLHLRHDLILPLAQIALVERVAEWCGKRPDLQVFDPGSCGDVAETVSWIFPFYGRFGVVLIWDDTVEV